ncbi:hypothetical protein IWX49DRAFT_584882 [Phyllosticta citricarpa]
MFLLDFLFLNHRRICLGVALTLASWRLGPRIALSLRRPRPIIDSQSPSPSLHHVACGMPQTPRKTSRIDVDAALSPSPSAMRAAARGHRAAASVPTDIATPPRSRANPRSHPQSMPRPGPGPSSSNSTTSSSSSSTSSYSASLTTNMSSHGRSLSHADAASRHSKRLSLNFPVQPAAANPTIPTPRSRPASWIGTSPVRSPEHPPHSPDANFFTALAAQERRVLELREELSKAEDTLTELKRQWATHEAARLGQKGAYGFHPLQPVDTVLANGLFDDDPEGPSWAEKEMERRRMILHGQRQSNRKVFSGSRHTRTLSLLSPTKPADNGSFSTALNASLDDPPINLPRGRSSTTPVESSRERTDSQDGTSEALLRTGRQMAADLKDGIMTFWGDLRQAAIGDEPATSPPRSTPHQNGRRLTNDAGLSRSRTVNIGRRKSKSIHPSGDSSSLIDIESNFWKEHGIEAVKAPQPAITKPTPTKSPQKTLRSQPSSQTMDEAWDDWDTTEPEKENSQFAPAPSSSNSSISELRTSPPESERSSPRTSTSSATPHLPHQHLQQHFADGATEVRRAGKPLHSTATASRSPRHTSASTTTTTTTTTWRALNKLVPSLVTTESSPGSPLRYILDEWDCIVSSSPGATSPTAAQACMAEAAAWEEYLRGTGSLEADVDGEVKSGLTKDA